MSFIKSIATFGGFTMISRITGFIRDMIIANFLGAGSVSDAFLVSFKLPNLFRSLFAWKRGYGWFRWFWWIG